MLNYKSIFLPFIQRYSTSRKLGHLLSSRKHSHSLARLRNCGEIGNIEWLNCNLGYKALLEQNSKSSRLYAFVHQASNSSWSETECQNMRMYAMVPGRCSR